MSQTPRARYQREQRAKLAKKVKANGGVLDTVTDHGLRGYRAGCRCTDCQAALAAYQRDRYQRTMTGGFVPQFTKHGYNGYTHGCRCDVCREAKREYSRTKRAAARARRLAVEAAGKVYVARGYKHGSFATYAEQSCRCSKCIDAMRAQQRGRAA